MVRKSLYAKGAHDDETHREQSKPVDDSDAAITPTDNKNEDSAIDGGPSSSKKRKLAAGGRGVANLTPDQLAKKRANDREAQRAIRERTKTQIQTLERRILELTSMEPIQELQAALDAKKEVERENAEIRKQLASIVAILQPMIGGQLPGSSAASAGQEQPPNVNTPAKVEPDTRTLSPPGQQHSNDSSNNLADATATSAHHGSNGHTAQRMSDLNQQREQLRHGLDMGPERLGLGFLLDSNQHVSRIQGTVHGALDTPQYRYIPHPRHDSVGSGSTYSGSPGGRSSQGKTWTQGSSSNYHSAFSTGYPYQGPPASSAAAADRDNDGDDTSNSDEVIDTGAAGGGTIPRYAAPVRTVAPTCPLDSLLLDFLSERRLRTAEGRPVHEVIGPRYPSVSSLLNPDHSIYSHPLSRVFTDILAKFPDISELPERVAVLYIMFLIMRWQVAPTRDNYERLPPWVRPLRVQLLTPHPAWIDHLPFPRMRERIMQALQNPATAGEYPFDHFFIPYTTTLTLSWPYRDTDTLLQSPHSEELMINPVFERHLRNLDNWKLGGAFARAFPGLADTCNIPEAELAAVRAATAAAAAPGPVPDLGTGTGLGGEGGMRSGYTHSPGM